MLTVFWRYGIQLKIRAYQLCNCGPHDTLGLTVGVVMMAVFSWVPCLAVDKVCNLGIQYMYTYYYGCLGVYFHA